MKIYKYPSLIGPFLFALFAFQPNTHAAEVSAWLPSWEVEDAFKSFQQNKDTIDVISPFWYHVNEDGTLTTVQNGEDQAIIDFAEGSSKPIIPTISNSFDGKKISGFLNDDARRTQNIQNIVDKVLAFDYDGIDIDYEGMLATDKDAFTAYIKALDVALDAHGKKLTIAVMANSYSMLAGFGERGQDWKELGKYVDEFRIMTYDYAWSGSGPRPVAPHYWVEEVVKYAIDQVPADKIRLGVPFYGYGWSDNEVEGQKKFTSFTYKTILEVLQKYAVDIQYDPRERTNRLFYMSDNDEREIKAPYEVWFENHVSLEPKLALVQKYNLGGIAIWRLGNEDSENWSLIRHTLKGDPKVPVTYFDDVTAQTPHAESIERLAFLGLVKGQGTTGLFDPKSLVNRAEILKMSLNSFAVNTSKYLFSSNQEQTVFPDVDPSSWYQAYIQTAVEEGVAKGYPDGLFRPGNNIIRIEALKLALESADVDLSTYNKNQWYSPYQAWAIEKGLYPQNFILDEEITRAETVYIIEKVIKEVEKEPQYSVFNKGKI